MADASHLSQEDIRTLFDSMGEELATYGSQFAFIQLRMSAERFVVPLCGLSADRVMRRLKPHQYHVFFEKNLERFKQGPVDLALVPLADNGNHEWHDAYCLEFKMVWMNSIRQNLSGIKRDIEKLSGYDRGFIVAVLFTFDRRLNWAPYSHEGDMEKLVELVESGLGEPMYKGREYSISNQEAAGKFKLVAWAAARNILGRFRV